MLIQVINYANISSHGLRKFQLIVAEFRRYIRKNTSIVLELIVSTSHSSPEKKPVPWLSDVRKQYAEFLWGVNIIISGMMNSKKCSVVLSAQITSLSMNKQRHLESSEWIILQTNLYPKLLESYKCQTPKLHISYGIID